MIFDLTLSISTIIALAVIVIGWIVQWVTLKGRSEANAMKIATLSDETVQIKHALTEMQLTMAKDFAPKTMINEVETRILERMTDSHRQLNDNIKSLTDEFREVRKILMER